MHSNPSPRNVSRRRRYFHEPAIGWGGVGTLIVLGILALGLTWWSVVRERPAGMAETCAQAYAQARTAADTARADRIQLESRKGARAWFCANERTLEERRLATKAEASARQ